MSKRILGLDIRRNSLTAVLVQTTIQGHEIESLAHIEAGDLEEDHAGDSRGYTPNHGGPAPGQKGDDRGERLLAMFERLAQTMDISAADCFVSFPSIDMSYRNLTVPFTNRKKIRQILPFELEPVMPGNVDDLAFDFITREFSERDTETRLVAAAVNSALLDSYESCLKRAGITVNAIIPGGSSAAEYLLKSCEEYSDFLYLDMGEQSSTLFVVKARQIASIRGFSAEGPRDTGLNISRTVLAFCEQFDPEYQPSVLYVAGPGSRAVGTADILGKTCDIKVECTDFRASMEIGLDERIVDLWDPALYSNALALCYAGIYGIKGLCLAERFEAIGKYIMEFRAQLTQTGFFLALVIIAMLVNVIYGTYSTARVVDSLDSQMVAIYKETFPSATKIIDPYAQMKAKIDEEKKKSAFAESNAGNIRIIDLLNDISKAVPPDMDIEFERFVLGSDDLKISGSTDNYATVDAMKTKLEGIDYFKTVVITSTSGERSENQVSFKLKIDF